MLEKIDRLVFIADGQLVMVNGEGHKCEGLTVESPMPQYGPIKAIQWYGDHGGIEYFNGPAVGFGMETSQPQGPCFAWLRDTFVLPWLTARAKAHGEEADIRDAAAASFSKAVETHEGYISNMKQRLRDHDAHAKRLESEGKEIDKNNPDKTHRKIIREAHEARVERHVREKPLIQVHHDNIEAELGRTKAARDRAAEHAQSARQRASLALADLEDWHAGKRPQA